MFVVPLSPAHSFISCAPSPPLPLRPRPFFSSFHLQTPKRTPRLCIIIIVKQLVRSKPQRRRRRRRFQRVTHKSVGRAPGDAAESWSKCTNARRCAGLPEVSDHGVETRQHRSVHTYRSRSADEEGVQRAGELAFFENSEEEIGEGVKGLLFAEVPFQEDRFDTTLPHLKVTVVHLMNYFLITLTSTFFIRFSLKILSF